MSRTTKELIAKAEVLIEALPYIKSFYGRTFVIKYGGAAQTEEALKRAFAEDVVLLSYIGIRTVIVHGGGPKISDMMKRLGKEPVFVDGHRVTDKETMDIVEMVLGGLVNKEIVSLINSHGGRAVGLSGKDGLLTLAEKKKFVKPGAPGLEEVFIDMGLVGQITAINPAVLESLDRSGFIPVIAPVGIGPDGQTYNINGDDMTAAVAAALKAEKLIYLTDVDGIRDKKGNPIPTITTRRAGALIKDKTITGGMLPKINSAVNALKSGVTKTHIIDGRVPHCLLLEIFTRQGIGTEITK